MNTIQQAYELRKQGKTFQQIADELGIAHTTARNYYKKYAESIGEDTEQSSRFGRSFIVEYDPLAIFADTLRFGKWAAVFTSTDVTYGLYNCAWHDGIVFRDRHTRYTVRGAYLIGSNGKRFFAINSDGYPVLREV